MKKFIQLSFREMSFKKYLIDIIKIDYVIEDENSNIGSFVYLEGLEKPFLVLESVRSINDLISENSQEQSLPIHLQHSIFRKK